MVGVSFPSDSMGTTASPGGYLLDGGRRPEEAAMKSSFKRPATLEQRAARKAATDGMSRALRELWKDEPAAPIPERLLRLLDQLEQTLKKP
jgi:hypothetical protein